MADTGITTRVMLGGTEVPCQVEGQAPYVESGLTITWGRSSRLEQPGADTASFTLVDPDGGDADYWDFIALNTPVQVHIKRPGAAWRVIFVGNVTDMTLTRNPAFGTQLAVTATDTTARLTAVMVGDTPWPAQLGRERRLAILATMTDQNVSWSILPSDVASYPIAAKDVDNQSAWDVITAFLWGVGLTPWPRATTAHAPGWVHSGWSGAYEGGRIDLRTSQRLALGKMGGAASGDVTAVFLDGCDVDIDGAEFSSDVTDAVQVVRVTYGSSDNQQTYVRKGNAPTDNPRAFAVESDVANAQTAAAVAERWQFNMAQDPNEGFTAPWAVGTLRVDPALVTWADESLALAFERILQREFRINQAVVLQNLPAWAPWRKSTGHVNHLVSLAQGGTYTFTDGRWVLDLNLSVEAAVAGVAPMLVAPGDVVPVDPTDSRVKASPAAAWAPGAVATFPSGPYGWDGSRWVIGGTRAIVVTPGSVQTVRSDDARVKPSPTTAWAARANAQFSNGRWQWDGAKWLAMVTVKAGDTTTLPSTARNVLPSPTTAWPETSVATFSDGLFRWTGTAWDSTTLPDYTWGAVPVGTAWQDVPVGTSWSEWNGV